ncbi:hypothetical protein IH992_16090 [Candidatus Poribacteria bacterium]|nr:hypothetical protein [Candidatus Poribacteria bacterium]
MAKPGKVKNDHQLGITRERLEGAFRALDSCGAEEVDESVVQSILFTIINLQREIIEYLDHKIDQQKIASAAEHSPKQIDKSTPI